jgi:hypothetical protein
MRAAVMLAVLMAVTGLVNGSIAWNKQESRQEPWLERAPGPVDFTLAGENTQNSAMYIFSLPFVGLAGSLAGGALCAAIQRKR